MDRYLSYLSRIHHIYNFHVRSKNREARFLVLVFFTLTFIAARLIVYGITYHLLPRFPFNYIFYRDVHIHHLVFGIILLLLAGFIRIPQANNKLIRLSSALYGIGAALTLDEFAIWLRLDPNAYFGPEGRISIDAVVLFTLVTLFTFWYGNFVKKILLFTLSFLGLYNPDQRLVEQKIFKHLLVYSGLAVVTFALVTTLFHSPKSLPKEAKRQVLHQSTVNKKPNLHLILSLTPTLSPTPIASASPTIGYTGFCMNVPVLLYHHIQPLDVAKANGQLSLTVETNIFDQQMQYLTTHGYTTISADQLVSALKNHTYLPAKDVVVTLDDAYEDNYTNAFPIAKKYHTVLNIMVPTGLLGVHAATNVYFTWDQLKEMVNSGVVNAYDHSWSHYAIGTGSVDKNQFEIMTPKQQLEQNLGKPVDIFTYPYGSGQTSTWIIQLLEKDGFNGAFSTIGGTVQCDSFIMALHRNHIGNIFFPAYGIY